jgi:hypothetical protein
VEQAEHKKDQRCIACIGRILDQVERCPAIPEHAAELTVQVGALRRQRRDGLGLCGIPVGPVIAAPGDDLRSTGIEPGVRAVAVKLDFVEPVGAVRGRFNERGQLWLDPGR